MFFVLFLFLFFKSSFTRRPPPWKKTKKKQNEGCSQRSNCRKKKQNEPITIMFCLLITIEGACDCERACECVFVCVHRGVIWNYFFLAMKEHFVCHVFGTEKKRLSCLNFFLARLLPSRPLSRSSGFCPPLEATLFIIYSCCSVVVVIWWGWRGGGLSRRVRNGTGSRFPAALMRGPHRRRHWKVKELEQTQRRLRQEACLFRRLCLQTVWCRAQRKTSWFSS